MHAANWRILSTSPGDGPWNMAVDEVLMRYARETGECVLRVYGWRQPTLSFGRHQSARGKYDRDRLARAGIGCVRRPTGGRAVLHFREVTYSVAARESGLGSLRSSYDRINQLLLHALSTLGVRATADAGASLAEPAARGTAIGTSPCFDQPSRGELVLDGRKLVGSAQWRDEGVLLQHGSILTGDDQSRINEFLQTPEAIIAPPATLAGAMGRTPDWKEVALALHDAVLKLEDSTAGELQIDDLSAADLSEASTRYADEAWTWRR